MSEQFHALFRSLERAVERPTDINAIPAEAAMKRLPMPPLTWLLLGLVAYAERLRWAWEIVHQRLPEQIDWAMKTRGELDGTVPGLPDWRYELGWVCVNLSHKGTGEFLTLALNLTHGFMAHDELMTYYCEHREPGVAELRLREYFPHGQALDAALDTLARSGIIRKLPEGFELSSEANRRVPAIANILKRWGDPAERLGLAVAVGDWPEAHKTAVARGNKELVDRLAPQAEQCRRRWRTWLCRQVDRRGINWVGIGALSHAGVDDLPRYLTLALADEDEAPAAIDLVADDPSYCSTVYRLLRKNRRRRNHGSAYVTSACVGYLNRHRFQIARVIDDLLADRKPLFDVLIPLVLEHRQDCLLPLLRRGLRSSRNEDRETATAVLALYDADWSRRELASWLGEADDWEATIECRLALRESGDAAMLELVKGWEAKRPEEEADHHTLVRTYPEHFRDRMTELFDLVHRHRSFTPDVELDT